MYGDREQSILLMSMSIAIEEVINIDRFPLALRKLNLEEGRLSTSTPVYHTSDPPHPATEQLTEVRQTVLCK